MVGPAVVGKAVGRPGDTVGAGVDGDSVGAKEVGARVLGASVVPSFSVDSNEVALKTSISISGSINSDSSTSVPDSSR